MSTESQFIKAVLDIKESKEEKTFAEFIAMILKDKIVEIYIGDSYEDVKYADSTQKYPAVVIGKVISAYAECLILNCAYMDESVKQMKFGNIVCLNERAIRTLTEVDGCGMLKDTFLSTKDPKIIKRVFDEQK